MAVPMLLTFRDQVPLGAARCWERHRANTHTLESRTGDFVSLGGGGEVRGDPRHVLAASSSTQQG